MDRRGASNQVADHLSRLENSDHQESKASEIQNTFPDETLFRIDQKLRKDLGTPVLRSWFADFANYLASGVIPEDLSFQQRKKFMHDVKSYYWDFPELYKHCSDQIIRKCVPENE